MKRTALVLGGTGYVGAAVLESLAAASAAVHFTWHGAGDRASLLAERLGHTSHRLDLRDASATRALAAHLLATGAVPNVIIHLASHPDWREIGDVDLGGWDDVFAVAVRGPFALIQALAGPLRERGADIVFATGLAPLRPVAAPPQAAASQAALAGLARSLTRALAPNVRANLVCLGTLDGGTATRIDPSFARDQARFGALGRVGTAPEAARAILWLALENRYISGATIPVAGGL
jgi:3-oxoacyl-[acyl-carrier protein] reductase